MSFHKRARTTRAIRREIAASNDPVSVPAQHYNVTIATIYEWRSRDSFQDLSHTAHTLQTTLTPAQETIVVHLRRRLLLALDELLAVTREFLNEGVSRSGLSRCLRRHGVGDLAELKPKAPVLVHKSFKSEVPGFVHMDIKYLPQMAGQTSRSYLLPTTEKNSRIDYLRRVNVSPVEVMNLTCCARIWGLSTD